MTTGATFVKVKCSVFFTTFHFETDNYVGPNPNVMDFSRSPSIWFYGLWIRPIQAGVDRPNCRVYSSQNSDEKGDIYIIEVP